MAVRQEQNQSGGIDWIIDGFEAGIGDSPFTGHELIQGFNIKNFPKVAYSNVSQVNSTEPAITSQINYQVQDPYNLNCLYAVGQDGVVYQSIDSGKTWTIIASSPSTFAHGKCALL